MQLEEAFEERFYFAICVFRVSVSELVLEYSCSTTESLSVHVESLSADMCCSDDVLFVYVILIFLVFVSID